MVCKRIIARLDIKGNRLIKGVRFEGVRVIGEPNEIAKQYPQREQMNYCILMPLPAYMEGTQYLIFSKLPVMKFISQSQLQGE